MFSNLIEVLCAVAHGVGGVVHVLGLTYHLIVMQRSKKHGRRKHGFHALIHLSGLIYHAYSVYEHVKDARRPKRKKRKKLVSSP